MFLFGFGVVSGQLNLVHFNQWLNYNPLSQSLYKGHNSCECIQLCDWSVLTLKSSGHSRCCVPLLLKETARLVVEVIGHSQSTCQPN